MIYYTGVGARKTPQPILHKMEVYGAVFSKLGYTLRSGAADGADAAFERGADKFDGRKEIYLPWNRFNDHDSPYTHVGERASSIASEVYGSRWEGLSRPVKLLMARNVYQILGNSLESRSHFVVCWTPDGARNERERSRLTGGTGQAIACASRFDIPVFNLYNPIDADLLLDFVGDLND